MFMEHYSQSPKGANNPNIHQLVNGEIKCGIFVQWNIIHPQKGIRLCYTLQHG